ncbi:MAG: hypothetical protein GF346_00520, partial [Candidatus Eisenbacteria bacterium]|nr:hypothetical protein [Candidatus Latescibacterota bacterium]MBD3300914.1 hypothetical protein [Candidatus Eisenbacteria bacterium]
MIRTRHTRRFRSLLRAVAACVVLGALGVAPAFGQYLTFGKNKVQYSRFDWHVLESAHVRVYFYPEEEELARIALDMAEDGYERLRRLLVHEIEHQIPLIIYSSHQDFEQTNITPFLLPEGVAGLTEYARGRVLVPFNGSLHDFRTTIHHELIHVFQLSLEERIFSQRARTSMPGTPLWFIEGLAVHGSEDRDTEADMVLRDMVLTGRIPPISEFWRYNGTFTLYKLGQSVVDYIAETHGPDRLRAIYDAMVAANSFEEAVEEALGVPMEELSARWSYSVRRLYYPDIVRSEPISFNSRRLTRGPVDLSPVPVPDGVPGFENKFLFLSPRTGYTNIYAASDDRREKDLETIVRGERGK